MHKRKIYLPLEMFDGYSIGLFMNWVNASVLDDIKYILTNNFCIDSQTIQDKIFKDIVEEESADSRYSLQELSKILRLCAHYTNCDHFALLLVGYQKKFAESLCVSALLGQHSNNLEEALTQAVKHQQLDVKGISLTMNIESRYVHLIMSIDENSDLCMRQIYAFKMAKAFTFLSKITAQQWKPTQVHFSFRRPEKISSWRDFFGKNLYFDSEYNGFIFDKEQLHLDINHKNPQICSIIDNYLKLSGQIPLNNKIEQIKSIIRSSC